LCAVVGIVGMRFNLWMDRYFLPLLPSIFILIASAIYHLYTRHRIFIVLLPALLFVWVYSYWNMGYVRTQEYTGLAEAFAYLTAPGGPEEVLVDRTNTGYSGAALDVMLDYYVPKDSKLKLIPLTPQTVSLAWSRTPKVPVLMMLCSQVHLMHTTVDLDIEEDGRPRLFGTDTCLFTVHHFEPVHQTNTN